jgi:hypothetical protein
MRRFVVVAAAGMIVASLLAGTVAGAGNLWKAPPFSSIGIQTIEVGDGFRVPESPSVLSIFVETGSPSTKCLATLSELSAQSDVEMLFCAPRNPTFDGGAIEGVWLHVFFFADPGDEMFLAVNVYQEGAKFWGAPLFCSTENGC